MSGGVGPYTEHRWEDHMRMGFLETLGQKVPTPDISPLAVRREARWWRKILLGLGIYLKKTVHSLEATEFSFVKLNHKKIEFIFFLPKFMTDINTLSEGSLNFTCGISSMNPPSPFPLGQRDLGLEISGSRRGNAEACGVCSVCTSKGPLWCLQLHVKLMFYIWPNFTLFLSHFHWMQIIEYLVI